MLATQIMTLFVLHEHPRINWVDYDAVLRKSLLSLTNNECEQNLRFRSVGDVLRSRGTTRTPTTRAASRACSPP